MKTIELNQRGTIEAASARLILSAPSRGTFAGIVLRARYASTRRRDLVNQWKRIAEERSTRTWAKAIRDGRVEGSHGPDVPWNWCAKCATTVDGNMTGEWSDGSEGTCFGCRTVYHAVAFSDGEWRLFEYVAEEEDEEDES